MAQKLSVEEKARRYDAIERQCAHLERSIGRVARDRSHDANPALHLGRVFGDARDILDIVRAGEVGARWEWTQTREEMGLPE